MANLKALKTKRQSISKTRKVTRAMEAVSAVKMRKAQERALRGRPYAFGALRILHQLVGSIDGRDHPLTTTRDKGVRGVIIITSDKGLAGPLNSAVLKALNAFVADAQARNEALVCICIGRRGHEYARARGLEILHFQENKSDTVTEDDMRELTERALLKHDAGVTRDWQLFYTNFRSTFEQEAAHKTLLPLTQTTIEEVISGITPERGAHAHEHDDSQESAPSFTIEPSAEAVLEVIIPSLVNIVVYQSLLESKASEHSARMVAMKNATDKAGELSRELLLKINKVRQAIITREVSEITSGIEAMK